MGSYHDSQHTMGNLRIENPEEFKMYNKNKTHSIFLINRVET
jgi:hypothetical protein